VQPKASASAIRHLEDLASPVSAFLRDRAVLDPDATATKDDVWKAWKEWAEDAGIKKGTEDVLVRDLRAVDPGITSTRPSLAGKRVYMLAGLRLQESSRPRRGGARQRSQPRRPAPPTRNEAAGDCRREDVG
jgi:putative DNA primase/helicase